MPHKCRNNRKIQTSKKKFMKKSRSPVNEFPSHACRNNKKMGIHKKNIKYGKKYTSPAN